MTPSPLLTPIPSTDPPSNADCTKRNAILPSPFGVITTHPAGTRSGPSPSSSTSTTPTPTPTTESVNDASDASINKIQTKTTNCTLVACPWTGAPIRAIIPLPQRKLRANGVQDTLPMPSPSPSDVHGCSVPASTELGPPPPCPAHSTFWDDADTDELGSPPPCPTRATFWDDTDSAPASPKFGPPAPCPTRSTFWDDADVDSGDDDDDDEEEEGEGSDEDCDRRAAASLCCSYESITAVQGLSAWSFEELRVECYAQSLVARGTKPPPAAQPALAIPPAFVPRLVPRN